MSKTSLSEIRIDPATRASGVTMTKGEEIIKGNPPEGQKNLETPLEEDDVSDPSWLKQVMQEVKKPEITKSKGPKIPLVSCERNIECYTPVAVSIGPYHYADRKVTLAAVEKLKAPMTRDFVEACGENMSKKLYEEVKNVEKQARTYYEESIMKRFSREEFMKMMFIDGCFILQFLHCINREHEKLEMTDEQVGYVKRDLLLLENQLPFPVLEALMSFEGKRSYQGWSNISLFLFDCVGGPDPEVSIARQWLEYHVVCKIKILSDKISRCYHGLRISRLDSDQPPVQQSEGEEEPSGEDNLQDAHLLDRLYSMLVTFEYEYVKGKLIRRKTKRRPYLSSGHYLYYSARNLKRVGIHFQPVLYGDLTDVKFKSSIFFGTLKLPRIVVNESTKSLLLNLVEYERSTSPDQFWVASYICFMDSLINDAKDVEELRSKGIIVNYLGEDQKVADLFNDMGKHLKPDASTYNEVKRKINQQCESRMSKCVAEWLEKYFGSPWTLIAVVAAALGLALTFAQTYYTRYPPGK